MQSKYLLLFRAVLLEAMFLQAAYAPGAVFELHWVRLLFPAYAALTLGLFYLSLKKRMPAWLGLGSFLLDIGATTAVLYFTSGMSSDFYIAYFLVILASCFLQNLRQSFVVGGLACVVYGALAFPGVENAAGHSYLLRCSLLLTTALFSAYVADSTRRIEREVADRYEGTLSWMQRLSTVGRAVSGVFHEVRTPLNTILLSVDVLRAQARAGEREGRALDEQLDLIASEAERAAAILRDFLDFSKPSELALRPLALREPVRKVLEAVRTRLEDRDIRLDWTVRPETLVLGSERHLIQVLMNLCLNAIDAMPMGGSLTVRERLGPGTASLDMIDTGVGIEKGRLERLFEPFESSHLESGGHGLGLHMARWIAEKHRGSLRLYSEGPGRGTRAVLTLPSHHDDA